MLSRIIIAAAQNSYISVTVSMRNILKPALTITHHASLFSSKPDPEIKSSEAATLTLEELRNAREIKRLELEEKKEAREIKKLELEKKREERERFDTWWYRLIIGRSGLSGFGGLLLASIAFSKYARDDEEEKEKKKRATIGLLYTVQAGDDAETLSLLGNPALKIDLDYQDSQQYYTALHHAAQKGYAHIVSALLKCGAKVDIKDKNDETPFYKAVFCGHLEVVNQLILGSTDEQLKAMVNLPNKQGNTPIMAAIYSGRHQLFEQLLSMGADIEHVNTLGQTALHFAMQYGRYEIAKKLILGVTDKEKYTPTCRLLVKDALPKIIEDLAKEINADSAYVRIEDKLFYVNRMKDSVILIQIKPMTLMDFDLKFKVKHPLFPKNRILTIEELKEVKLMTHQAEDLPFEYPPLCLSKWSYSGWLEKTDKENMTPLCLAVRGDYPGLARLLIERGANVNHKESRYLRPLFIQAVSNGQKGIFDLFFENKSVDKSAKSRSGLTAYDTIVCITNSMQEESSLSVPITKYHHIKNKLYDSLSSCRADKKEKAFASFMCKTPSLQTITDYLQCGGTLVDKNEAGKSLLDYFVLDKKNFDLLDDGGNSIFHLAARFNDTDLIKKLLEALPEGMSLSYFTNKRNKNNNATPVYEAALFGSHAVLKLFIENGGELYIEDAYGWTPLSAAVWSGHLEVIDLILNTYKKKLESLPVSKRKLELHKFVNHRTIEGSTALWWAVQVLDPMCLSDSKAHAKKLEDVVFRLLENEGDINIPDREGFTPFHLMAIYGLWQIAERLVKNYFVLLELSSANYQERALHHAAIFNRYDMVKFLVENKVDIHAVNAGGRTAFDLTTDDKIRDLLIDNGYNHKPRGHSYKPPSEQAVAFQNHSPLEMNPTTGPAARLS